MMDESKIQLIVNSVLKELGEAPVDSSKITEVTAADASPSSTEAASPGHVPSGDTPDMSLDDLGSDKFKKWYGVKNAVNDSINQDMMKHTTARLCLGRTGPRPLTIPLLRFLADHSRSKDTVVKEVAEDWLQQHELWEVHSQAKDKDEYLTRPDLGRKLSDDGCKLITERCEKSPQVQLVISDGLSTDATVSNYDELLPPLLKGLQSAGLKVGTPFFLRYGRVKAQDQIGQMLNAEVNLLLIGERPGLGQSESLSCYAVYRPDENTVESDRTVLSNIHRGGTPPVEAAAVIVDLAKKMLEKKASGINLNR
ncbi:Ethanolamine ammonia-lyase light chain [BD1-7 clade bacterium]|uniref:Ethanolamine ammonia-lyase small subunit n=1 Tax=BD1-7 clade bacterium TaxID=2029982 RepID=A0A5S9QXY1_9GAMM|nr:Ethanolamine ammonia-lyase light chain [BD1-7 clade bacterium]